MGEEIVLQQDMTYTKCKAKPGTAVLTNAKTQLTPGIIYPFRVGLREEGQVFIHGRWESVEVLYLDLIQSKIRKE